MKIEMQTWRNAGTDRESSNAYSAKSCQWLKSNKMKSQLSWLERKSLFYSINSELPNMMGIQAVMHLHVGALEASPLLSIY